MHGAKVKTTGSFVAWKGQEIFLFPEAFKLV
jgi:hypothetical protein